ncbi:hypothetical protein DL768_006476 [Monosporascus sp. mg162]|nr:hypothetical protein DL768_006476 [Monosporascus sp. mg162]
MYCTPDSDVGRISDGISIVGFGTAAAAQFFADFPAWRQLRLGALPPPTPPAIWSQVTRPPCRPTSSPPTPLPPRDAGGRGGAGTTARHGRRVGDNRGAGRGAGTGSGAPWGPRGNRKWVNSAPRLLPPSSKPPHFTPTLDQAWMDGSISIIAADRSPARLAMTQSATAPFCVGNCTAPVQHSFPDASEFQTRPCPRRGPRV